MLYQAMLDHDGYYAFLGFANGFPLHWHSEIEIIYCLEGVFNVTIDGRAFTVNEGQTVFIGSITPHEYTDNISKNTVLLLEIGEAFLKNDFQNLAKFTLDNPVTDTPVKIQNLFDKIISEIKQPGLTGRDCIIKSCLFELAAYMLREIPGAYDINILSKKLERIHAIQKINKSLEYLRANYKKDITFKDAMQLTGYEKSNFFKQFKKATQMTFHKYLNTFRVSNACIWLSGSNESIENIAKEIGFTSTKTFCRVFKNSMNMTPTEYRKLTR